jgi:hypothetical protein
VKIEESVERINQALEENEVHPDELALYTASLTPVEFVVYREAERLLSQSAKPVRTRLAPVSPLREEKGASVEG